MQCMLRRAVYAQFPVLKLAKSFCSVENDSTLSNCPRYVAKIQRIPHELN